jgi:transcription antitermination factor NusG
MVEQRLLTKDLEVFLPLHSVIRRWKNRTTVKVDRPLFSGYVFAKIALNETVKVLSVPRVFSIVGNGREPLPLPDAEIEALRAGLSTENAIPWPNVKVGTRARINCGPLAGLEGIVVRTDGQFRIVISVNMISRSVAIHVSAEDMEICGEREVQ